MAGEFSGDRNYVIADRVYRGVLSSEIYRQRCADGKRPELTEEELERRRREIARWATLMGLRA